MRSRIERLLRGAAAIALAVFLVVPELAFAIEPPPKSPKSLDAMSQAELDTFVAGLNQTANWRKYRRPTDPPDFVPGKPVRVMHGAGASLGRGRGGGARSFRQSGLASRRGGSIGNSRRRGSGSGSGSDQSAMESGRGSSRSSSSRSSSGSRSSFGGSSSGRSNSSFGSGSGSAFSNGNGFE